ncbi:MAG: DUF2812 domain-containing protein [Clostridia bacterium]|nr:DUF2812 domain-containing protein [Clostridia bacterium]
MESWLTDLAQEGLFLEKDGFFAGVAAFVRQAPRYCQYRLEAVQKKSNIWAEDRGTPDPEQIELSAHYAWEYVDRRGNFYIYRRFDQSARELNTDPDVQAMALRVVQKRMLGAVFSPILYVVLYSLLLRRVGLLTTIINMKTWFFLFVSLFVLWTIISSMSAVLSLGRLRKKLISGAPVKAEKSWRKKQTVYLGKKMVSAAFVLALLVILLARFNSSMMKLDKTPLEEFTAPLPFATISDLVDAPITEYKVTMQGMGLDLHCVRYWRDWLAPQCYDYNESARLTLADGRVIEGCLWVDYYQTLSPAFARILALEHLRLAALNDRTKPLSAPDLPVSFAGAYLDELHYPTLILQHETVMMRITFYQFSRTHTIPFTDWAIEAARRIISHP